MNDATRDRTGDHVVEESGLRSDPSLAHCGWRDGNHVEISDEPLGGLHDKEADARATEKYFRRSEKSAAERVIDDIYEPRVLYQSKRRNTVDEVVAELVDLAAEKQKRLEKFETTPISRSSLAELLGVYETKDSGAREEFPTGSRRDTREGKGRYDLLPPYAIQRLAQVYERGAAKYGDRNWEKGQPLSRFLDSALRHTFQVLEGKTDEDHAMQACWNLVAFVEIQHRISEGLLPAELNDL